MDDDELILFYRAHASYPHGSTVELVDETAAVEERLTDALAEVRGAEILDKSGCLWRLRVP